ncbi:YitT family protein [Paenibacillus koleovorans]|uniref:YitT family protein n=1 Tax=Paenibacillus koleovorans TaxID=121608 RepID=UPI000FD91671|nr:YitT family protein [Paenibacillus koleovorans]
MIDTARAMLVRYSFVSHSIMILIGAALFALAIQLFAIPNQFVEGGATGIVLLLHYAFHFKPSLTTFLLNIPVFIAGWRVLGVRGIGLSAIGACGLSFFLWVLEYAQHKGWLVPFLVGDYLLAALYAGLTSGLGLGLILRYGGSMGGTTLIARMLHVSFGLHPSKMILLFDVVVIGAAVLYIPLDKVLYTFVMVYVASRVIHLVNREQCLAKEMTVYAKSTSDWASQLFGGLAHGYAMFEVTFEPGGQRMQAIRCLVSRSEWYRLKREIKRVDPAAIMIVHDVHDMAGQRSAFES